MKSLSTKLGRRKKKEVVIPICAGDSFGVRDFVTLCTSETHPIYADHIALPETIKGTLGLTLCPGKRQDLSMSGITWSRSVLKDIKDLQTKYNMNVLVSLMEEWEFENLQATSIPKVCAELGVEHIKFAWKDGGVPEVGKQSDENDFKKLVYTVYDKIVAGDRVVVHCMGGLGRTGTLSVCLTQLLFPDKTPTEAFDYVRKFRKGACDAEEQEDFVKIRFPNLLLKWNS